MFIFLDESGDLGFNFLDKRPSDNFVMTLLVCPDCNSVKDFHKSIRRTLKNKINHTAHKKSIKNELKGTITTIESKNYFLRNLEQDNKYELYSMILDKKILLNKPEKLPYHANTLYNQLACALMEKVDFKKANGFIHLVVDRSKNAKEIKEFNLHISHSLPKNSKTRIQIDHHASYDNPCIQAVDLFSWGIFGKYEHKNEEWYSIYKHRIKLEELYLNF